MRKIKRKHTKKDGYIVPQRINKDGYNVVDIEDEYGRIVERNVRVDKLVAEAFIRRMRADEQVEHIDGCKTNNRADNLRIVRKK